MTNTHRLDTIDLRILANLQREGRMTNTSLAESVGLSQSPCLARVKRLEQLGFISGYGASLNWNLVVPHLFVHTEFTLERHTKAVFKQFEAAIIEIPEVLECHLISGGYDYLVQFVVRDLTHYQNLVESLLEDPLGIKEYFSYVTIKEIVRRNRLPIRQWLD